MKDKKNDEIKRLKDRIKELEKSEALRQRTEEEMILLSSAVRMSKDSIVISDLEGRITYVNEVTLKMYRIENREELIGRDSFELIVPDEQDIAIAGKEKLLKTGKLETREHHITTRNGDTISVEMGIAIVKNAKGEPIGFITISRDITERKKSEEALWKSYKQWETTFDAMNDSIFLLDMDLKILKCNYSTTCLLGKSYQEIIGNHCWQLVHGTSSPIEGCPIIRMKKTLKRESIELPIGNKWFDVIVDPIFDSTKKLFGAVHIISDITDRKQAENTVQETKDKYRKLFELGSDAIFLIEVDTGRILDLNNTALKMYGYSRKEALQMKNTDFSAEPAKTRQATVEGKQQIPIRYHKKKNGTYFPTDISVAYFKLHEREVCIAAIRDITDRKQAEEELEKHRNHLEKLIKERTKELEEKNRKLENFNKLFIDREFRIKELKDKVKELEKKSGRKK